MNQLLNTGYTLAVRLALGTSKRCKTSSSCYRSESHISHFSTSSCNAHVWQQRPLLPQQQLKYEFLIGPFHKVGSAGLNWQKQNQTSLKFPMCELSWSFFTKNLLCGGDAISPCSECKQNMPPSQIGNVRRFFGNEGLFSYTRVN